MRIGRDSERLSPARMVRRIAAVLLLGILFMHGCDEPSDDAAERDKIEAMFAEYREAFPDVSVMTVEEYLNRRDKDNLLLIDGRTPEERKVSMIPGAVPLEVFEDRLEDESGRDVVIYCTIGYRSAEIAEELSRRGVRSYNLKGGVLAWAHANRTFIDEDGKETRRVHVYGRRWNLLPKGYEAVW
jgi:sodium/bile acid cotransporter 7